MEGKSRRCKKSEDGNDKRVIGINSHEINRLWRSWGFVLFCHDFRANDEFIKSLVIVCNRPVSIEKRVSGGDDFSKNGSARGCTLDVADLGFN